MPHYKHPETGNVYFYETLEERNEYGAQELVLITEAEADAYKQAHAGQMESDVPASCTRRQGLLALLTFGFRRADIEDRIAAITDETEREEAQIEYEASVWERANQRLQHMWAALGGTPAQLDDLFRLAVTL